MIHEQQQSARDRLHVLRAEGVAARDANKAVHARIIRAIADVMSAIENNAVAGLLALDAMQSPDAFFEGFWGIGSCLAKDQELSQLLAKLLEVHAMVHLVDGVYRDGIASLDAELAELDRQRDRTTTRRGPTTGYARR